MIQYLDHCIELYIKLLLYLNTGRYPLVDTNFISFHLDCRYLAYNRDHSYLWEELLALKLSVSLGSVHWLWPILLYCGGRELLPTGDKLMHVKAHENFVFTVWLYGAKSSYSYRRGQLDRFISLKALSFCWLFYNLLSDLYVWQLYNRYIKVSTNDPNNSYLGMDISIHPL